MCTGAERDSHGGGGGGGDGDGDDEAEGRDERVRVHYSYYCIIYIDYSRPGVSGRSMDLNMEIWPLQRRCTVQIQDGYGLSRVS